MLFLEDIRVFVRSGVLDSSAELPARSDMGAVNSLAMPFTVCIELDHAFTQSLVLSRRDNMLHHSRFSPQLAQIYHHQPHGISYYARGLTATM